MESSFDTTIAGPYMSARSLPNLELKKYAHRSRNQSPGFLLKSKNAAGITDVKLSANAGQKNTVILFFPLAFTGVCTTEMCDITAGLSAYSGLNADVIAISVDSPFAQEAWAKQHNIGITIASDLNKKTATDYGVLLPDLGGFGAVSARCLRRGQGGGRAIQRADRDREGPAELRRREGSVGQAPVTRVALPPSKSPL